MAKSLESISFQDVSRWTDPRSFSRGRQYQDEGRVRELVAGRDGRVLATVAGSEPYAVAAWLVNGKIKSRCVCPVGYEGKCKHAVALLWQYLKMREGHEAIPPADPHDPRWEALDIEYATGRRGNASAAANEKTVREQVAARSHDELAELLFTWMERFPQLKMEFGDRLSLAEGKVDKLLAEMRKELHRVTSVQPWKNRWTGEAHAPDYTRLLGQLEQLLAAGHADAIASLAPEIVTRGLDQLNSADDEGESAAEFAPCLTVTFDAVARSAMPALQKLLLAIDAQRQDHFGIIDTTAAVVLSADYKASDWSVVADELQRRLSETPRRRDERGLHHDYARDKLADMLAHALTVAGRKGEVDALLINELRESNGYQPLVRNLIEQERYDEAERWAMEGMEQNARTFPGIAMQLAAEIGQSDRRRKCWDRVAAYEAHRYFDQPTVDQLKTLLAAARRAKCEDLVRKIAHEFLETGVPPIQIDPAERGKLRVAEGWPLPTPLYLTPLFGKPIPDRSVQPHFDVLIELALADKRNEDAIRWYDRLCLSQRAAPDRFAHMESAYAERVAAAVAATHPTCTLEIYFRQMNRHLGNASTSSYQMVAGYLRKMWPVMVAIGRSADLQPMIDDIRRQHKTRRRFLQILTEVELQTIRSRKAAR